MQQYIMTNIIICISQWQHNTPSPEVRLFGIPTELKNGHVSILFYFKNKNKYNTILAVHHDEKKIMPGTFAFHGICIQHYSLNRRYFIIRKNTTQLTITMVVNHHDFSSISGYENHRLPQTKHLFHSYNRGL